MQYLVAINQARAVEWGLNAQQAMLFAFLHQVPTWADARQLDGQTFYNVSKSKVVAELPLLTDKQDTAYRLMKQLAVLGVIQITSCDNRTYMRLTEKGKTWNRGAPKAGSEKSPTLSRSADEQGSEKYPTSEKSPSGVGKISEPGSEKSPTNQDTNDPNPNTHTAGGPLDHAQQFADDGQPLVDKIGKPASLGGNSAHPARKHAMALDWEPNPEMFAAQCYRAGMSPETRYEPHQLAKFVAHHAGDPNRQLAPAGWIGRFVDWVRNDQRNAIAQPQSTGGAYANGRQRTPPRRRTAAEARAAAEAERQGGERPSDGQWHR
ncbi:DnaT-like ssDNA-binding domain-containing protein [Salinicola endophyticus]|uniref:DnaT-like ssDNA-binding domain-containing protein n=1 Tax=Salinicola endophyticus TaxID=1949083 RepID=A0AB74UC09_9GAMM